MGRGNRVDNCSLLVLLMVAASCARVTTKFGDITGLWSRSSRGRLVTHYLGIPYARPPLGDLRFRVSVCFIFLGRGTEFFGKIFSTWWVYIGVAREGRMNNNNNMFPTMSNSATEPSAVGWNVERDFRGYEKCPTVLSDVEGWEHDWRRRLSLSQCLRAKSEWRKRGMKVRK